MNNQYDWKKIIKMVAVIGVLCLFVGIATRVMQKSQTSLNDYARKNPEVALAKPDKEEESGEEGNKEVSTEAKDGKEDNKGSEGNKEEKGNKEVKDNKEENGTGEISEQEIYDSFYYTDEKDGYKFRVMYYNSDHKVCKAEMSADVDDPQEALQYFYDLFKAEHEFKNYAELKGFLDKF